MTRWVPRFDDWLNELLEESARTAGEDVDAYVARAVATQLVADQRAADSPDLGKLLAHLSSILESTQSPAAISMTAISDPDRLRSLYATGLLDSPPEEMYDRITRAATAALDAPHAALTLVDVDRQFFKSSVGMDLPTPADRQTPLERSVCQYAVAMGEPLVLEDMREDPLFKNHPAVLDGTVVAYLGIPLTDADNHSVGTLCVFDSKPRQWGTGHLQVLSDLAKIAADRIFGTGPAR
ncbi:MAG: GAF domain-containing protein [Mycobacterium sp.]